MELSETERKQMAKDHKNRVSGANAVTEGGLMRKPARRFKADLKWWLEKLQDPTRKLALTKWQEEIDEMNKQLSALVRNEMAALEEEYRHNVETRFYTMLDVAKQEIDIPPIVLVIYCERNEEGICLTEELSRNRVADIRKDSLRNHNNKFKK